MKKIGILSIIIATLIAFTISLPIHALGATFTIDTEYSTLVAGDTFEVVIEIKNISDTVGIVAWESGLYYDSNLFSVIKWEHNKPVDWGLDFEDMTGYNPRENRFICGYLYGGTKNVRVFDDGVLFSKITFKVLSQKADGAKILLKDTFIYNDYLEERECNEGELTIHLTDLPTVSGETDSNEIETSELPTSDESDTASENESKFDDGYNSSTTSSSEELSTFSVDSVGESPDESNSGNSNIGMLILVSVVLAFLTTGLILIRRKKNEE